MLKPLLLFCLSIFLIVQPFSNPLKAQEGCTNLLATNYDPSATIDDGSCEFLNCDFPQGSPGFPGDSDCEAAVCADDPFCCDVEWDSVCAAAASAYPECSDCLIPTPGCTNPAASNYNPEADINDGSCEGVVYCNQAQGSPGFPGNIACETAVCDTDGFCCSTEWDGICADIAAVTPACASCLTPGCSDPLASNYSPLATAVDDSLCEYQFCDQVQDNPGFPANSECSQQVCSNDPYCCNVQWDAFCTAAAPAFSACSECLTVTEGCTDPMATNFNPTATVGIYCDMAQGTAGFPHDPICAQAVCEIQSSCCETAWDASCADIAATTAECSNCATSAEVCDYNYCDVAQGTPGFPDNADCETAVCADDPFCCETQWDATCASAAVDYDECTECLTPVPGCTDPSADNFDPNATNDDGSCEITGCTDPTATNYNPFANNSDNAICDYTYCNVAYLTPGFSSNTDCEAAVCASDAFCCDNEWDSVCASEALEHEECFECLDCSLADTLYTVTAVACEEYVLNGFTYTESGVYEQNLLNSVNCDSVVELDLTINESTTINITETACDSYEHNGTTYTSSGLYTQTGTNAAGCEETTFLNLTINSSSESNTSVFACDEYEFNGTVYSASGNYSATLTNAAGCDSTANLDLTIPEFDTSIAEDGSLLTANDTEASYQWLDCNDGLSPIDGATNQNFTVEENGSYAVQLTRYNPDNPDDSCTVISACVDVVVTSTENVSASQSVVLFPNPNKGDLVWLELSGIPAGVEQLEVLFFDARGSLVSSNVFANSSSSFNRKIDFNESLEPGLYLMQLNADGEDYATKRLVIQ